MPKIELAYLLSADQVIVDSTTGKYSYIGVFQKISIPKSTGFYYGDFSIGGRILNLENGNVSLTIELIGPDKKVFAKTELGGLVESGDAQLNGRFNNIKFTVPGIYTYRLVYKKINYTIPGNKIEVEVI